MGQYVAGSRGSKSVAGEYTAYHESSRVDTIYRMTAYEKQQHSDGAHDLEFNQEASHYL